jgi:serine/threonine-protein kinase
MQAPEVLGGRYELRGVLGRGGMAEVRDGWDIRLDRPVAVKLLHPVFTMQPDNRDAEVERAAAAAQPSAHRPSTTAGARRNAVHRHGEVVSAHGR